MKFGKAVVLAVIATIGVLVGGMGLFGYWWFSKPAIDQNYQRQFTEMREPPEYTADDDGWHLLVAAYTAESDPPRFLHWDMLTVDTSDTELGQLRAWIVDNRVVLDLLQQAMAKKYMVPRPQWPQGAAGYSTYSQCDKVFRVRNLLIWKGRLRALDGDVTGGIADVLMAARIGRYANGRLTWEEWRDGAYGAAYCCFGLGEVVKQAMLDEVTLASLLQEIQDISEQWEDVEWPLAFQSLAFMDTVQWTFTDNGHGDGRMIPAAMANSRCGSYESRIEAIVCVTAIAASHPGRKATIECYNKAVAAFKDQWGKRLAFARVDAAEGVLPWMKWAHIARRNRLVRDNLPGDEQSLYALYTKRNEASRAMVTIAVMRYKAATGQLPDGLADVAKAGYLEKMPKAWYNDEEFVYEKKDASFVIYTSLYEKKQIEEQERDEAIGAK